jgi:hypothetical protein
LISAALEEGRRDSTTLRRLVETIDGTDGIVYIASGTCPVLGMRGCLLHVLNASANARYLWIVVDTSDPRGIIALIAHELQHALEVLQNPSIRTGRGMANFYRFPEASNSVRIKGSSGRAFETDAAVAMGEAVRADMAAAARAAVAEMEVR